ncbi:alpha/beta fold hydrolase [Bradyrhizobium sp. HKCCYLRH3099]|uniref:alpha/beta fold hydrolase n=1 Tax=unclassified Bradyrhizobium TaxID=2631580 RepID=UPI003EB8483D
MLRSTFAVLLAAGLWLLQPFLLSPALAGPFLERLQARMAAREAERQGAPAAEYAYGADPLQKLDFWQARGGAPAPLVVFVHGGGWKRGDKRNATGAAKVEHMLAQGYAFASIDYRLVPAATVEQQAADVAAAVAWLRNNAGRLRIDPSRIVLMGHSAGAHLVALVGTDPRYFTAAGVSLRDVSGIIALDGACYDVARQLTDSGRFMLDTYIQAFGTDPARQRALSPTLQAAKPNAPAFLILHVDRADGKVQSEALGAALTQAGTPAEVAGVGGTGLRGHMEINRELGDPSHPATAIVDTWLRRTIGK